MTGKSLILTGLVLATLVSAPASNAASRHHRPARSLPAAPAAADDVQKANAAARVMPQTSTFANAEQVYAFMPGSLYQVYTSVGKVTDIALQPGERLVGTGPVAAGDTARWVIGTTESGSGDGRQVHILVKPTLPSLATNLVINSDRRTYHIELQALPTTYMASVSWRYPQDELVAVAQAADKARAQEPIAQGIDPARLNFNYRLDGDSVAWKPLRVFDDGAKVYVEMPPAPAGADLPPLFLIGADGKAELVNYRVQDNFLVVDRLLDRAELRLGDKGHQKVVRIRRFGGQPS
ncbi:P-type conjugative transfer protein TrbG [Asticcacaulis solisilvae]|uniref:P-type conjugative transfer protein TrbG n=1 Tax=Asticcacaulis solisilvae TaxID=1217274 RepID=UPI003FD81B61